MSSELHDAALEAVPGPKRAVVEDQEDRLVGQEMVLDPAAALQLELESGIENRVDLFLGEIREGDEVSTLQQFGDHVVRLSFHRAAALLVFRSGRADVNSLPGAARSRRASYRSGGFHEDLGATD